jgi:hypothetical protein
MSEDGAIERYLDELIRALAGRPPRELRALLAEAEAHLHDDADAAVARGMAGDQAEREAVARFGSAADVAAAERALDGGRFAALVRQLFVNAVLLGGIGAVAVGVSGLAAALVRVIGGSRALVDVQPGQTLAAADCTRWLALNPTAGSCRAAAISDWANETVYYRLALGVLGVVVLAVGYRLRRGRSTSRIAATVRDAVGLAAFALGAAGTLLLGIDGAVRGTGAGQWLSGAAVAVPAAGVFAVLLLRDLRGFGPVGAAVGR